MTIINNTGTQQRALSVTFVPLPAKLDTYSVFAWYTSYYVIKTTNLNKIDLHICLCNKCHFAKNDNHVQGRNQNIVQGCIINVLLFFNVSIQIRVGIPMPRGSMLQSSISDKYTRMKRTLLNIYEKVLFTVMRSQ